MNRERPSGRDSDEHKTPSPRRVEETVDLADERLVTCCRLEGRIGSIINITVIKQIGPVLMDSARVQRVLLNLVQNAIRYAPPAKPIEVRARQRQNGVAIEVTDHGPGIAPEHRQKIFERFYRVDKARSRAEGGAGLGLAIVKWSIERMGGTVELSSELGKGSTFRLHLRQLSG